MIGKLLTDGLGKKGVGAFREAKRSENGHSGEYKRLEVKHDFGKSQSGFWMKRKP